MTASARIVLLLTIGLALNKPALAWGLYTHVYFAQALLLLPIGFPLFAAAIRKHPQLVLTGSLLPDFALFSRTAGVPSLASSHNWSLTAGMLNQSEDAAERALALGFASHLIVDVVAHHDYVPEHQRRWKNTSLLCHAASEWAMDAFVATQLAHTPKELLTRHEDSAVRFMAKHFSEPADGIRRACRQLAAADGLLRMSGLPRFALHASRWRKLTLHQELRHYLNRSEARLIEIDHLLAGELPLLSPETAPFELHSGEALAEQAF